VYGFFKFIWYKLHSFCDKKIGYEPLLYIHKYSHGPKYKLVCNHVTVATPLENRIHSTITCLISEGILTIFFANTLINSIDSSTIGKYVWCKRIYLSFCLPIYVSNIESINNINAYIILHISFSCHQYALICIFMRKNINFLIHVISFVQALLCAIGCVIHALQNAVICKQNTCGGPFQTNHFTYFYVS